MKSGDDAARAFENCSGMALGLGGARARRADGNGMGFALLKESHNRPNLTMTLANYGRQNLAPGFNFSTIQVITAGQSALSERELYWL